MSPQTNVIRVLLRLLSAPYRYSRKDLIRDLELSESKIKTILKSLRSAGLNIDINYENHYTIAVLPEANFQELKHLQPLSDGDKARIGRVLDFVSSKEAFYIRKKLSSLYDFQQLGLRALRRPHLERIDRLKEGKRRELQVILENYRSNNSNTIRNRLVEPFHIDPEKDTLQAYDLDQQDTRHFRLSRIERVTLTEQPWANRNEHRTKITDVFRIADNQQVLVHLLLDVYAYNELTDRFPLTRTYTEPGSQPNTYDFQCQVNQEFKGIMDFIMGNARHVRIIGPEALRERVYLEAKGILDQVT